jgi:protein arginine kinase activator
MQGIVCQICAKRPATTHLTEIDPKDGHRREVHLCGMCVEQMNLKLETDPPTVEEILEKKSVEGEKSGAQITINLSLSKDAGADTCPSCGLTFAEFAVNNRFGCATCYTGFGDKVETLLSRYHGSAVHVGRLPAARASDDIQMRRASLDAALREAVANEAYERAAAIRDEIRRLEERKS